MFRFLLLAAFIPALALGQATSGIRQCTGGRPFPTTVNVVGCAQTPCDVPQGTTALMDVSFVAPNIANTLRPEVIATALGATGPYPLDPSFDNGCNYITGATCPVQTGQALIYHFRFQVSQIYPPIPVAVELTLRDHLDRAVFCAIIDIIVRTSN